MFERLTADEIISVRELILLLSRLRVIGTIYTETKRVPLTEFGKPCLYTIIYKGYDSAPNAIILAEQDLSDLVASKRLLEQDIYNE
jgi:hypothetical protein